MRIFFTFCLISSHPKVSKIFYIKHDQQSFQNLRRTFLWKNIRNFFRVDFFCFFGFASSLLKYKSPLSLGLESSISRNIRNFFRGRFFSFPSLESSLVKYQKFSIILGLKSSISRNLRKTF